MSFTASWTFERTRPRSARRDPFEAEFFTGEGDSKQLHGRTDALVREVLQNSLDARLGDGPVRVRFAFHHGHEAVPSACYQQYMAGLVEHLDALGNEHVNSAELPAAMDYLVVEDFGTRGLTGCPCRVTDPDPTDGDQSFYWFWRNIGRSGKYGTSLGRWGLGKTVFPSASHINAFWGLTVRACDGRHMLMGQAITKIHRLGSEEFEPEGVFHDVGNDTAVQMPLEQSDLLSRFKTDFRVERADEPGLSIVVPFLLPLFEFEDVVRSIVVHFFVPILKQNLVVEVQATGTAPVILDRSTIRQTAESLHWTGSASDKKNAAPPLDLAEWAIEQQASGAMTVLNLAGGSKAPVWDEELFPKEVLDRSREIYQQGGRLAFRAPVVIEFKDGSEVESYLDAFVEPDEDVAKGEDHYVREGMTISKISQLAGCRGNRGLVLIDDESLSALLGDAEGPAHVAWGESEDRPDRRYHKWVSRVRFAKNSLLKLIAILAPPPEGLDVDLLRDIFAIDDPTKAGSRKRRRRKKGEKLPPLPEPPSPPDPPDPPPPPPPLLRVTQLDDNNGFRVTAANGSMVFPLRIYIRAAYDTPAGNPFAQYSPFDFVFEPGKKGSVSVACVRGTITNARGNGLVVQVDAEEFSIEATGFDPLRDLVVDPKIVED